MKHWQISLAVIAALSVSIALADDFKTTAGKEYKNATVSRVEADGIVIKFHGGIAKIFFVELPPEIQKRFGYDVDKLKAAQEKRIEAQNSAEREREEKEKKATAEREEKEKNAEADLKRSVEEFEAAEQRASKAYESAAKGTVSGQVFVSTHGGENFKLGAVQIGLFARDAIEALLSGVRKYADVKIEELRRSVAEAKAAQDRADVNYEAESQASDSAIEAAARTSREYENMQKRLNFCYSGGFYLDFVKAPIRTAETDADGKFAIEVPKTGRFVIAAQAKRSVGNSTEHYYWLQPISLEGKQQLTQNLSNNNLTSTTGSSALIHTRD